MKSLTETMAACFEQVAFFFNGDPQDQESFVRRAESLGDRTYEREKLVAVLQAYHERLGAGPKTFEHISLLKQEGTLAVVTGQQAGFLTGPLYTLYKALTAIRLAEEQSLKLQCPVVPVFWVASEDHDWAEVRETIFLNQEGKPMSCVLPGEGGGVPVGNLKVPAWGEIEGQLREALPDTEFRAGIWQTLQGLTDKAENLADWFALVLQWLVQDRGLIFFDPMLPEIKRLAMPMYERILGSNSQIKEAFQSQTDRLVEQGYALQIRPTGEETNLCLAMPERRAVLRCDEGYHLRGLKEFWDQDAIVELIRQFPEKVSANVVTRPVVQDYLLPVLAYIPGPGELNYWAQLGKVFEVFGYTMPVLFPRLSAVVLTQAWQKSLAAEGLAVTQVCEGLGGYREQRIKELDDLDIDGHFARLRERISEAYGELAGLQGLNPSAPEWISQNEEKVAGQVDYLEKKMWQAQRKRMDSELRRLQQLEDGLCPRGGKQERVLNPLSFVSRYGLGFVDSIAALPLTGDFRQQEVRLE